MGAAPENLVILGQHHVGVRSGFAGCLVGRHRVAFDTSFFAGMFFAKPDISRAALLRAADPQRNLPI